MVNFEIEILNSIQSTISNPFFDTVMPYITYLGSGGIIWIAMAVIMLISQKNRKTGIKIAVALILSLIVCNFILKPLTARVRPYGITEISLLIGEPSGASFPSGHASASFAAAVVLMINKSRIRYAALVLAVLIAFSRLYLYVHYPSDVLAGAALGTALAFAADWIVNKFYAAKKRNEV